MTASRPPKVDHWMHRQAIQIVAQLPDDPEVALAVLTRARELLVCWEDRVAPQDLRPTLVRP
jgi:hypothetical protein